MLKNKPSLSKSNNNNIKELQPNHNSINNNTTKISNKIKKLLNVFKKSNRTNYQLANTNNPDILYKPNESKNNTNSKVAQIIAILRQQDITRSTSDINHYLKLTDYDVKETCQYLTCLALAEVGILVELGDAESLVGVENASGTSCYIDTVLFAMYSQLTAFDCLLHSRPLINSRVESLQVQCRFFVNLLRQNLLVRAEVVERIRNLLIDCGWGTHRYSQEDAAEFFLFLSEVFESPFLPFNVQLFHGLSQHDNDFKVTSDRVISLSLPPREASRVSTHNDNDNGILIDNLLNNNNNKRKVIAIEELLMDYFYNNKISGLRRSIEPNSEKTQITDAWSVVKLLPFYTSQNELGNIINLRESELSDSDLILPLIIKRYHQIAGSSQVIRDNRPITLSTEINFNKFIKKIDEVDNDQSQFNYFLELKSIVCHIGTTLQSGHYIVFVRDPNKNDWVQMDDLKSNNEKIYQHNSITSATHAFEMMSRNSYLLFYKLKVNTHFKDKEKFRMNTNISLDAKIARKLQAMEFINDRNVNNNIKDGEKSCSMQ